MEQQEVFDSVLTAVRKCVRLQPEAELTEATNLADDLAVDSLDIFDLCNEIEGCLGVRLSNSEENSLGKMTIGGIVDFLIAKLTQTT